MWSELKGEMLCLLYRLLQIVLALDWNFKIPQLEGVEEGIY